MKWCHKRWTWVSSIHAQKLLFFFKLQNFVHFSVSSTHYKIMHLNVISGTICWPVINGLSYMSDVVWYNMLRRWGHAFLDSVRTTCVSHYRPRSRGDNMFGSVRVFVCMSELSWLRSKFGVKVKCLLRSGRCKELGFAEYSKKDLWNTSPKPFTIPSPWSLSVSVISCCFRRLISLLISLSNHHLLTPPTPAKKETSSSIAIQCLFYHPNSTRNNLGNVIATFFQK